ncbi:MAG TPA: formate dehydrogenase accessory protein FdhE [Kofleriaceae bacterium]|jgi:FdhE protein|nr:formate dehydrogenase accessory protein FdhE [Kofleriaceae bacterium]
MTQKPRSSWLSRETSVAGAIERRATRAALLAEDSINAAALQFAAGLYRAQAEVAVALAECGVPLSGSLVQDLDVLAPLLEGMVRYAAEMGPPGLRADVDAYLAAGQARLVEWWRGSRAGRVDYLSRALLRPYAETLVAAGVTPEPAAPAPSPGACLRCGGPAWIGWRRSGSGDEAAQRFLGCGVCGSERQLGRIACAACGETSPDKLPVFQTERYPGVRIEACDACLRYHKSIDLTLDGRAIPEVDDLCSLSLDLWAVEQGYERLEPSLAGV